MALTDNNIVEAGQRALFCFGTAKIVENRMKRLKLANRIIKFLGLFIPLIIGGIVLSFGSCSTLQPMFTPILGALALVQLVLSLWALVANWDQMIIDYSESKTKNLYLCDVLIDIYRNYTDDETKYDSIYKEFILRDTQQRDNDNKNFNFSDKEKRLGMRYGLWLYQWPCAECNKIPNLRKPDKKCSVCGK